MDWLKELLKDLPDAAALEKNICTGIGKHFVAKADFNAVNQKKKRIQREINEINKQLEALKKEEAVAVLLIPGQVLKDGETLWRPYPFIFQGLDGIGYRVQKHNESDPQQKGGCL